MTSNSSDPLIGRLVDGRYQVRSRIARGGMATVYLATDLRLERRVAIKVMHGHLADDSQYRARFIQEARSAARLAHPNVVNVYDQGQDAETAYLVMEYLPGITLRDLLDEHRVLTTDQTFDIMEAVLSGLAAAHKNGIVHRDLKPENVLLADDGRIKIGDFGLARAATANTATGNALLGTIAYLSPELVTRGIADTRSDIYAVGIMLYEMLAGEQPFKGEQPFQIAHQHANNTVGTPSSKNPTVPAELDELVLWATARDPDQRPRDARTMLDQVLETQTALRAGTGHGTASNPIQRTMVLPRLEADPGATPPATSGATQILGIHASTPPRRQRTGAVVADSTTALTTFASRRRSRGFVLFTLFLIVTALVGGTGWYFGTGPGALIEIPDVAGRDIAAASAQLTSADLAVSPTPTEVFDPVAVVGTVVGTRPATGEQVAHQGVVTLLVSKGPGSLPLPPLAGLTEAAAEAQITAGRFATASNQHEFSASIAKDVVIRALASDGSDLAGQATYLEQRPITLVVSSGAIPAVAGMSVGDAQNALTQVGLVAAIGQSVYNNEVKKGSVISGSAPKGLVVKPNDTITLTISLGIEQVAVPDVIGMGWLRAKPILLAAGFVLDYDREADGGLASLLASVHSTNPDAGKKADKGSTIKVRFTG